MIWMSSEVPRVQVTSAWVSPRVNRADPCVRGSRPTSQVTLRISSKARPSRRSLLSSTALRNWSRTISSKIALTHGALLGGLGLGQGGDRLGAHGLDGVDLLELAANAQGDVERRGVAIAQRRGELGRPRRSRSGDRPLRLAAGGLEAALSGDDVLDHPVRHVDRVEDLRLADALGAGLDHHDRVLGAGDDDLELGLGALGVGRIDQHGTVDEGDAHGADRVVERALREQQGRG